MPFALRNGHWRCPPPKPNVRIRLWRRQRTNQTHWKAGRVHIGGVSLRWCVVPHGTATHPVWTNLKPYCRAYATESAFCFFCLLLIVASTLQLEKLSSIEHRHWLLTLTYDLDFQSQTSYDHDPCTHKQKRQFKDQSVQIEWKQTDTTDCINVPANALGNNTNSLCCSAAINWNDLPYDIRAATLLMFLNVNLRLIFSTLPMLPSHVPSPAPTNNILVTYGALQVLYCIVLYCI